MGREDKGPVWEESRRILTHSSAVSTDSFALKAKRWTYSHWNRVHLRNSLANLFGHLSWSLNNLEFKSLHGAALKLNFLVDGHGALNSLSERTVEQSFRPARSLPPSSPAPSQAPDIIIPRKNKTGLFTKESSCRGAALMQTHRTKPGCPSCGFVSLLFFQPQERQPS